MCIYSRYKMRIELKNLFGVTTSLFFSCGAFTAVYSLSSTIHATNGLGLVSFSLLFVGHSVVCLFGPILVAKCGTKHSMVLGILCWIIYIGCNLYPKWYILLPVSIFVGLGSTPLWIAAATHLTSSGIQMAKSTSLTTEAVVSRFIGVYTFAQLFSTIPGNVVSSLVLFQGTTDIDSNSTRSCGVYDCQRSTGADELKVNDSKTDSTEPHIDSKVKTIMFCSLLACCIVGLFIVIFSTDPLRSFCDDVPKTTSMKRTFKKTIGIMGSPTFLLVLPFIALSGFELGMLYGVFTKSFVSCTLGVHTIGLVMAVSGFGGALLSLSGGTLAKYTGWIPIATVGFVGQVVTLSCMLTWNPVLAYDNQWHLYLMAFMLCGGATLRVTHVTALLGILYPSDQEAVYGAHLFFHFLFYALPTALRIPSNICTGHLLQLESGMLGLAMIGYYLLEYLLRRTNLIRNNASKPSVLSLKDKYEMVSTSEEKSCNKEAVS